MQTEGNIFEEDDSDSELLKWRNEGHFYDFRGNQIFIIELGNRSKPPVVFLHGFPTSSFDYKKVWNMLSDEYRLISFDLLGFGFSDKPRKKKYSILEQADIVEEVLSSLGITSSFLVAHDYGSIVAQELLHRTLSSVNGFKWKGVVFLNGALFPYLHRATFSQRLMASPFSGLFLPFFGFDKFKASLNSILGSRTKLDDLELQKYWILYKRKKGIIQLSQCNNMNLSNLVWKH